ncbi:MAG: 2,3-bisphosphoglycerate-independent phosphoglycerate mutase [Rhodospirillales bacterium]
MRHPGLLLAILDGWGHARPSEGNVILGCGSDRMQRLAARYPSTLLDASGEAVGLPDGVMGNSEVGHLTIGAGRIIFQDLTRINRAVADGTLADCTALTDAFDLAVARDATVHFLGLCSDAGVHAHLDHLEALLAMATARHVPRLRVHAFTDGRDTPPDSGQAYVGRLAACLSGLETDAAIATLSGRYFAMDRDRRWDRLEKAWRALVLGEGLHAGGAEEAVSAAYARGETDEFIQPTVIDNLASARIEDGDVVIFTNFRADRAREMTAALTAAEFEPFARPTVPALGRFVCMTAYDDAVDLPVAFGPQPPGTVLGAYFAARGARQLRIAETEKYAHVTYFLNGGVEHTYPGEERVLVPSSKVATYDLEPAMRTPELTRKVRAVLTRGDTDVIVLNLASADMVGHTGNLEATRQACAIIDRCMGELADVARARGTLMAITADHGNAEQMIDPASGGMHTAHTTNPVPLILVSEALVGAPLAGGGGLSSVLPTLLAALQIETPPGLEGRSLL